MQYLVDTHILIGWVQGDKNLKAPVKRVLTSPSNKIFVSVVSGAEIAIKIGKKKLKLKTTPEECFARSEFEVLRLDLSHALKLSTLPLHHKDPFDRLLISQAQIEKLTLITADRKIWKYKLPLLKA